MLVLQTDTMTAQRGDVKCNKNEINNETEMRWICCLDTDGESTGVKTADAVSSQTTVLFLVQFALQGR